MDRVEDGSLDRQELHVWRTSEMHDIPIVEMCDGKFRLF